MTPAIQVLLSQNKLDSLTRRSDWIIEKKVKETLIKVELSIPIETKCEAEENEFGST
jgi:hypothetical protein